MLSESELEFWRRPNPDLAAVRLPVDVKAGMETVAKRSIEALQFHIETVDGEHEVVPGVRVFPAPGHTPGHLAILIESDGERLLHIGDAAVHPLHVEFPELHNGFDQNPEEAGRTRRELLETAASDRMRLMAFHFPFPSVGSVTSGPGGAREWSPGV